MQDNGYLHPESWEVLQVTAWIPLLNATRRNGCMQVVKGGHRAGKTCKHSCCVGGTWCACSGSTPRKAPSESAGTHTPLQMHAHWQNVISSQALIVWLAGS